MRQTTRPDTPTVHQAVRKRQRQAAAMAAVAERRAVAPSQ
jgi:hypothetical protein